jgi:hypothetical protein
MKAGQEVYLRPSKKGETPIRTNVHIVQDSYVVVDDYGLFYTGQNPNHRQDYLLYEDIEVLQADIETERLKEEISIAIKYNGWDVKLSKLQQIARIMGLSKSAEKTNDKK